jgi:hypothetical protein
MLSLPDSISRPQSGQDPVFESGYYLTPECSTRPQRRIAVLADGGTVSGGSAVLELICRAVFQP